MLEFSTKSFITTIKSTLESNMPVESDSVFKKKHAKRLGKMREIALANNGVIPLLNNSYCFDLGNEMAEQHTPHYHILEDAEVIRKAGKGTKRSKGSQDKIKDLSKRDYGRVSVKTYISKKTGLEKTKYSQEYRSANRRGSRSLVGSATRIIRNGNKVIEIVNKDSNYYVNEHYHYIEKILDKKLDGIANQYGLKRKRTKLTSLEEDFKANRTFSKGV